ncbi:MAG: NUDIX domain-containing protein [Candidatus Aenigmarchaeota archaeon]|nr:NUDIX domain-containing protein [Candidatus Aenigmarchaeota archaeon]
MKKLINNFKSHYPISGKKETKETVPLVIRNLKEYDLRQRGTPTGKDREYFINGSSGKKRDKKINKSHYFLDTLHGGKDRVYKLIEILEKIASGNKNNKELQKHIEKIVDLIGNENEKEALNKLYELPTYSQKDEKLKQKAIGKMTNNLETRQETDSILMKKTLEKKANTLLKEVSFCLNSTNNKIVEINKDKKEWNEPNHIKNYSLALEELQETKTKIKSILNDIATLINEFHESGIESKEIKSLEKECTRLITIQNRLMNTITSCEDEKNNIINVNLLDKNVNISKEKQTQEPPKKASGNVGINREKETQELIKKAEEMGKYFKGGFGNRVGGIAVSANQCYLSNKEDRHKLKNYINFIFPSIEKFYINIPFLELNKKEFRPLFEINELLPLLKKEINNMFQNPTKYNSKKIYFITKLIVDIGRLYGKYLDMLVYKIRQIAGYEDYKIRVLNFDERKNATIFRYIEGDMYKGEDLSSLKQKVSKARKELQDHINNPPKEEQTQEPQKKVSDVIDEQEKESSIPNKPINSATIILLHKEKEFSFLLTKRASTMEYGGKWVCPGGKINEGEKPVDAAIRELKEETGLSISPDDILKGLNTTTSRDGKYLVYPFIAHIENISDYERSSEIEDERWISLKNIKNAINSGKTTFSTNNALEEFRLMPLFEELTNDLEEEKQQLREQVNLTGDEQECVALTKSNVTPEGNAERIWNTLATFVPKTEWQKPPKKPIQILELCCNTAFDVIPLICYFGGTKFKIHNNNVKVTCLDIETFHVHRYLKNIVDKDTAKQFEKNIEFIQGNAINLSQIMMENNLPETFDIIIFRNPFPKMDFYSIIMGAIQTLSENGLFIITTDITSTNNKIEKILSKFYNPKYANFYLDKKVDKEKNSFVFALNFDKYVTMLIKRAKKDKNQQTAQTEQKSEEEEQLQRPDANNIPPSANTTSSEESFPSIKKGINYFTKKDDNEKPIPSVNEEPLLNNLIEEIEELRTGIKRLLNARKQ